MQPHSGCTTRAQILQDRTNWKELNIPFFSEVSAKEGDSKHSKCIFPGNFQVRGVPFKAEVQLIVSCTKFNERNLRIHNQQQ